MNTYSGHVAEIAVTPSYQSGPEFEGRIERQIGKFVGLTQFGVNHLTLDTGSMTSRRHWHEGEDEFVYVLSGAVTLRDDNGEHELGPGAFVGFPAGVANAHHLINRSSKPALLIVVGSRKVGEEMIHYPDQDDPGPFSVVRDAKGNRLD